jgi:phosphoglucomutase
VETAAANTLMEALRARLATLPGQRIGGLTVAAADDFAYTDPVDDSVTPKQGVRVTFAEDARVVFRLSGTGTAGATLRVYLERFQPPADRHDQEVQQVLAPVIEAAEALAEIRRHTGRDAPSIVT